MEKLILLSSVYLVESMRFKRRQFTCAIMRDPNYIEINVMSIANKTMPRKIIMLATDETREEKHSNQRIFFVREQQHVKRR